MTATSSGRARSYAEAGATELSFEALGFVLPVLSGDAARPRRGRCDPQAPRESRERRRAPPTFVISYGDDAYLMLHSDRRDDPARGADLDQPGNDVIPKLVRLFAHRTAGRWLNTQESACVLLGLDRYFRTFEKVTPDFVARVWLGDTLRGDHTFNGRTDGAATSRADGGPRRGRARRNCTRKATGGSTSGSACCTRRGLLKLGALTTWLHH